MGQISHTLPNKDWKLWTRGGTHDVYIQKKDTDEEIEIPSSLLRMLVAAEILSHKISVLEQMEDNEILGLPEDD